MLRIWLSESLNWDEIGFFRQKLCVWIRQRIKVAIRVDFVPRFFMIACRAGRLNFSPSFLHVLSVIFDIQIRSSCKTHALIIQFCAYCYRSINCSLIWLKALWFSNKDSRLKHFVCLPVLKLHSLCRQTVRTLDNTVCLSTFLNLLWYLTAMQTQLLSIQTFFRYLFYSPTQKCCLLELL